MVVHKGLWLVAACAALASSPLHAHSYARCSQRALDQRSSGLEPGVWISDASTAAGFVFFAADSARSRSDADRFLTLTFLSLASLGPYLSLAGFTGGGCVVRPDEELANDPAAASPFRDREEARAQRAGLIRMQQFVLGMNLVASGVMLLLVHDRGSRIALGTATAFPAVYSLLNLRKFSAEREDDAALPARAAVGLIPLVPDRSGRAEAGVIATCSITF